MMRSPRKEQSSQRRFGLALSCAALVLLIFLQQGGSTSPWKWNGLGPIQKITL